MPLSVYITVGTWRRFRSLKPGDVQSNSAHTIMDSINVDGKFFWAIAMSLCISYLSVAQQSNMKNKPITIIGKAENGKGGALVLTQDGTVYYLEGIHSWDVSMEHVEIEVAGTLYVERLSEKDLKNNEGERKQGSMGIKNTILKPTYKRIAAMENKKNGGSEIRNKTGDVSSGEGKYIIVAPIVKKAFVNKAGKATGGEELFIRRSVQDYFIKFCEGHVTRADLEKALIVKEGVEYPNVKLEIEIKEGNWDICEGDPLHSQSRIGEYMVIHRILSMD